VHFGDLGSFILSNDECRIICRSTPMAIKMEYFRFVGAIRINSCGTTSESSYFCKFHSAAVLTAWTVVTSFIYGLSDRTAKCVQSDVLTTTKLRSQRKLLLIVNVFVVRIILLSSLGLPFNSNYFDYYGRRRQGHYILLLYFFFFLSRQHRRKTSHGISSKLGQ